jgi:hypothetical protein
MLSNEPSEFESAYVARAFHKSGKEPFADDWNLLLFCRVFLCVHAWFLCFESSENPKRGNQVFSCLYPFKNWWRSLRSVKIPSREINSVVGTWTGKTSLIRFETVGIVNCDVKGASNDQRGQLWRTGFTSVLIELRLTKRNQRLRQMVSQPHGGDRTSRFRQYPRLTHSQILSSLRNGRHTKALSKAMPK